MNIALSNGFFKDTIVSLFQKLHEATKIAEFGTDVVIGMSTTGGEVVFDRYYVDYFISSIRAIH